MMEYILSTLATAALFVGVILLLAAKPKLSKIFTYTALGFGGICGLLIYGYGYTVVTDNVILAILKAVLAVCGSFVGNNNYEAISAAPFMQTGWMQMICTFVQICSLYATGSAVISAIGAQALKRFRLWLGRNKDLHLVYGMDPQVLAFCKELAAQKNGSVVMIAPQPNTAAVSAAAVSGCVLLSDLSALTGDEKFLRKMGLGRGKRKLFLYALHEDPSCNLQYAEALLSALNKLNISADRLRLVILGQEEIAVSRFQQTPRKYGYGFVTAVNEPQMAARLLMLQYPPCNAISFDAQARATDNFKALLIGFGKTGQAVLKALVMNGQFEGSRFKLDVFACDLDRANGNFACQNASLLEQYDIHFHNDDARSHSMYAYLKQHAADLRYIVVSIGDERINHEIAEELVAYLGSVGCGIPVYECTRRGVAAYHINGKVEKTKKLYSRELLCTDTLDQSAMILNHSYQSKSDKTPLQHWMECDYFSRRSCRAAADFIPALLRAAAGVSEGGSTNLTEQQVENLSRTEHLRWCAFHYCMGFSPMSPQEYEERAAMYRRGKAESKPTIRIGKNMAEKTHACLIPWDQLDALSARETEITGKPVDYKALDTENILTMLGRMQGDAVRSREETVLTGAD